MNIDDLIAACKAREVYGADIDDVLILAIRCILEAVREDLDAAERKCWPCVARAWCKYCPRAHHAATRAALQEQSHDD